MPCVLTSIAAAEDGQNRWLIRDATRTFLLVAEPKGPACTARP
jgi:hypothetical protein